MRPFKGVQVLDLTHVFAGPFCAYQLGVLGAEIIKIEAVDQPDMTRSEGVDPALNARGMGLMFQAQAGGKKALALNLKTAKGRALFDRMVTKADVVIQNFSARCVADLGLGYERLKALNPSLIYCVISGYGQTGPKQFHPAYDNVIQAYSGLMAANGDSGQPPLRIGPAMVDYGTGAQAALAISAALYGRAQTGQGRFIDVSMADSALMLMTSYTAATIATGDNPEPHGNQDPKLAGYGSFETADGTLMIGAFTNRQMSNLMRAVGDDLAAEEITNCPRAQIGERQAKDVAILARVLQTKTADDWETILNDHHVPAAKVRRLNQALAEDQIASRNVTQRAVEGQHSSGLPVAAFSYDHGTPQLDHPPRAHGQDSRDVLAAIGVEGAEFEALRQQGVVG